jgi:hypothetical protein
MCRLVDLFGSDPATDRIAGAIAAPGKYPPQRGIEPAAPPRNTAMDLRLERNWFTPIAMLDELNIDGAFEC